MRNVIKYFLLLLVTFGSFAFQPPEQPKRPSKKMEISPQEFEAQARPEFKSYLSLLPADLQILTASYAYSTIEDAITATRAQYLNDPSNYDLINKLWEQIAPSKKYSKSGLELLLNTPDSFERALQAEYPRNTDIKDDYESREYKHVNQLFYRPFAEYISLAPLSYQEAIEYAKAYIQNIQALLKKNSINVLYDKNYKKINYLIDDIIFKLSQRYLKELILKYTIPEIKVATDIGNKQTDYWIYDLQNKSDNDILDTGIFDRFAQTHHYKLATAAQVAYLVRSEALVKLLFPKFRKALCNQLEALLLQAITSKNNKEIIFLLPHVANKSCWNKELLEEKKQEILLQTLSKYLLENINNTQLLRVLHYSSYSSTLFKIRMLETAIQNPIATSEKIIQFLAGHGAFWFKEYYDTGFELLLAAIKSPYVNADLVNYLLNNGADPNSADKDGITVLMHAIKNKRFDMAALLLNQPGINVNACDNHGWETALSNAQFLPDSDQRDILIATLKQRGAQEPGVCAIQ